MMKNQKIQDVAVFNKLPSSHDASYEQFASRASQGRPSRGMTPDDEL